MFKEPSGSNLKTQPHVRDERLVGRRVRAAAFRELKPLDEFDQAFNPGLPK